MVRDDLFCPMCGNQGMRSEEKAQSGRVRWRCRGCNSRTTQPLETHPDFADVNPQLKAELIERIRKHKKKKVSRYVITSAQNNTGLHPGFLSCLNYCKENDAILIVIPTRYKNVSAYTASQDYDVWYPEEIKPYLLDEDISLGKHLKLMASIKVQATTKYPLSGKENLSGTKSAIYGHPQVAMRMVATPMSELPKMLHTTGSISQKSYSNTDRGAVGHFNHKFGAVVVETKGNRFHIRELSFNPDGGFYDLTKYYRSNNVSDGHNVAALVTGDEHAVHMAEHVKKATYSPPDSIVNTLRPETIVRHDVLDFYSRNHHHKNDPITNFAKHHADKCCVRQELNETINHIEETTPEWSKNVIVASNHNEALMRWLKEADPKTDPENAILYHELMLEVLKNTKMTGEGLQTADPFQLYAKGRLNCRYEFTKRNEPHIIKGIDVSQHGDKGVNGARGSAMSMAKSNYKMIIGHSHSPMIEKGVYQVGTSTGTLDYCSGLSSWFNTHCIIYPDGNRSMIHIIKGEWRA